MVTSHDRGYQSWCPQGYAMIGHCHGHMRWHHYRHDITTFHTKQSTAVGEAAGLERWNVPIQGTVKGFSKIYLNLKWLGTVKLGFRSEFPKRFSSAQTWIIGIVMTSHRMMMSQHMEKPLIPPPQASVRTHSVPTELFAETSWIGWAEDL